MNDQIFVFQDRDTAYNVYDLEFTLLNICSICDSYAKIEGIGVMSSGNLTRLFIEYWYEDEKFYRIVNRKKNSKVEIHPKWMDMSDSDIFFKSLSIPTNSHYKQTNTPSYKNLKVFRNLAELYLLVTYNVPVYRLEFIEYDADTNKSYPIVVRFTKVLFLNRERIVFGGNQLHYNNDDVIGTVNIEYEIGTQEFYRVDFSLNSLRIKRIHSLIPHNKKEIMELVTFIEGCSFIDK